MAAAATARGEGSGARAGAPARQVEDAAQLVEHRPGDRVAGGGLVVDAVAGAHLHQPAVAVSEVLGIAAADGEHAPRVEVVRAAGVPAGDAGEDAVDDAEAPVPALAARDRQAE